MILTGTFEFSHVNMVVVDKTDVYHKVTVGKTDKVILWHKEHCPKVFKPDDIKNLIQSYLDSPFYRVSPSETSINIYRKTKKEQIAEKLIPCETLFKRDSNGKETVVKKLKKGERIITEREVKPGKTFIRGVSLTNTPMCIDEFPKLSPQDQKMLFKMMR